MSRSIRCLVPLFLATFLLPALAHATVRPGGLKIRWLGDLPAPTRAGEATLGRFEIVARQAGVVENVRIEGAGWTVDPMRAPARMVMARGDRRSFEFRATPADGNQPIVVSATLDGRRIERTFRLDAASLERARRPRRIAFADGAPSGQKASAPRLDGQSIRFRGRFVYRRAVDGLELGADSIHVQIMDDDSPDPFDEVIWEGFTSEHGYLDVSVAWDDGLDDPDIYINVIASAGIMDVHDDTVLQNTYQWTTEGDPIEDYTGSDVQFGVMTPSDSTEFGAVSVWNGIRKSWRHAWERAGMAAPGVEVFWPNDDGTYYDLDDAIYITAGETWTEGTITHEFGHHLHDSFGALIYDGGDPAYCGGGHCIWCPESEVNAFAEGFAGWFGYTVLKQYVARYGIPPLSITDFRYTLETPLNCQQPPNAYLPGAKTEGFTGALLRDIEDPQNDDHDGGGADCDMDVLTFGDDAIYTILRDDDPSTIWDFITDFRLRYNDQDQNFWSTVRNVWTGFGFPAIPPIVSSPPQGRCKVALAGETVVLSVQGNGALLQYQWRRNGENLADGGGVSGATTQTLTLSPTNFLMSGTYNCFVSTCDGTLTTVSLPFQVSIHGGVTPKGLVSWGSNESGQIGDGTLVWRQPPTVHENLPDMVKAVGGGSFSVALRASGQVLSWGYAAGYGELGDGVYFQQTTEPAPVAGLTEVVQIAAGDRHTLALKRDGTVWGWGYNGYGNLGDGTETPRATPVPATAVSGCVRAIASGRNHCLVLMADGTVQAWGQNDFGLLGRGTAGGWSIVPEPVSGLTDVEAISACGYLNLALKTDGTVWAWGSNQSGALGIGVDNTVTPWSAVPVPVTGLPVIRKITAGANAGFAISNEGAAYSWGSNQNGLQGANQPLMTHRSTPGLVPGLVLPGQIVAGWGGFAAATQSDGTVWVWGYNNRWPLGREYTSESLWSPVQVHGVSGVTAIGSGWSTVHVCGNLAGVTATDDTALPVALALSAAPNPSLGRTRVAFDLPREARVTLAVYDIAGRRVRTLFEGSRAAGRYAEVWDGRGEGGPAGLAGVYFVRLDADGETINRRIVRIR